MSTMPSPLRSAILFRGIPQLLMRILKSERFTLPSRFRSSGRYEIVDGVTTLKRASWFGTATVVSNPSLASTLVLMSDNSTDPGAFARKTTVRTFPPMPRKPGLARPPEKMVVFVVVEKYGSTGTQNVFIGLKKEMGG